jgi:hypothetical protein
MILADIMARLDTHKGTPQARRPRCGWTESVPTIKAVRAIPRRPRVSEPHNRPRRSVLACWAASAATEARPIDNGWPLTDVKSYHIELFNPYKAVGHLNQFACRSD